MLLESPKCHCKDLLFKNSVTQKKGLRKAIIVFYILAVMVVTLYIQLIAANKLFVKDYLDKTLSI